ncbi:glycoside hydrolase family 32 protein [Robertkochia marina]|nr:glycoside hydrolase family 32 protein [Robertkochia marina]
MNCLKHYLLPALLLVSYSCKQENKTKEPEQDTTNMETAMYTEKFRPQFHFSPAEKWMNDPNGLVFHQGLYHLFYQYYPDDIVWGPMHWGHAVSKDLLHWEHKPIALYPDELGYIFSGSAVVDTNNSSGLGSIENPPLVAIYTYHDPEKENSGNNDHQTQGIAYSLDNGDTWTKYEGNPVIDNNEFLDFRDPKVFWDDDGNRWLMLLVAGDHLQIYSSENLIDWTYLSDFGKEQGAHGGVWECPDMFPLQVEGSDEVKWVLLISINPGGPNGGSATQYFVGEFDGTTFTSDQQEEKWVDWGADNYAGVTYNNVPDGERVFIGWMSNWNYARNTPTEVWRSAMTLPRELSLHKINGEYELKNYPIEAFDTLAESMEVEAGKAEYKTENFNAADIKFTTGFSTSEWRFYNEEGEELLIILDADKKLLSIDRSRSGQTEFHESFADQVHTTPIGNLPGSEFEVRIILDESSVEIFLNKGQYVMTEQLFPDNPYTRFSMKGTSVPGDVIINKVERVW